MDTHCSAAIVLHTLVSSMLNHGRSSLEESTKWAGAKVTGGKQNYVQQNINASLQCTTSNNYSRDQERTPAFKMEITNCSTPGLLSLLVHIHNMLYAYMHGHRQNRPLPIDFYWTTTTHGDVLASGRLECPAEDCFGKNSGALHYDIKKTNVRTP